VVLVAVLGVLWSRSQTKRVSEADINLSQVVSSFASGQFESTVELAGSVQSRFPGTKAATIASYLSGASLLQLGKPVEAEQAIRAYIQAQDTAPFYSTAAQRALGAALESQGKNDEAAKLYEESAAKLSEPLASQVRLDAARAWIAAGSRDAARAQLDRVAASDNPQYSHQAKAEIAVLDALPAR